MICLSTVNQVFEGDETFSLKRSYILRRFLIKALSSVIMIKFSIKIQVGMSFLQKYKFDFDAIYSVYMEYLEYGVLGSKMYVFGPRNPVFGPQGPIFGLKKFIFDSFVSFVICFVFRKIQFWHNMEYTEYGKKRVPNFAKIQKSEYSAFHRALFLIVILHWLNFFSSPEIIFS